MIEYCVLSSTAQSGEEGVLPVRHPLWSGPLQRKHRSPASSAGSLQEAATCQTLPGRHEGV